MVTHLLKYCLIISCIALYSTASAQKYAYERKADQAAKANDFYTAAVYYEKAIAAKQENIDAYKPYNGEIIEPKAGSIKISNRQKLIFKLAEAYRQYQNWDAAAPWYAQAAAFTAPEFITAKYWHAVCLRAKENYDEAAKMLELFLKQQGATNNEWTKWATQELANCTFALEQKKKKPTAKYQITKLPTAVNIEAANYAPMLLAPDVLTFTSSRNTWANSRGTIIPKNIGIEPASHVNDLFQVSISKMNDVKEVNLPVDAADQGVASFSTDKTRMYFTRWKTENGKKMSNIYFTTQQKDGKWAEPVLLNNFVNLNDYSSKQPSVSADGRWLFFSSDRPGGMGSFDLWVCSLGSDGLPLAQAINLRKVNSAEEDEAPFYNAATTQLFFSSNGRPGFGGLDFYVSTGTPQSFSEPKNLGEPFNSSKDDAYFTTALPNDPTSQVYISTDRASACCLEIFNINRQQQSLTIAGKVLSCKDKKVLTGVLGSIKDLQNQSTIATVSTDDNGKYNSPYKEGQKIRITFKKEGFLTQTKDFEPTIDKATNVIILPDVCLEPIEVKKAIVLPEVQYDYNKATLRPESEKSLNGLILILQENPTLKIQMAAHTDSKGSDKYNQKLSEARAKSCVEYLIQHGIAADRLTYKGFGAKMPVAPNTKPDGSDNPEGRQKNRRTEFSIQSQ